MCDLDVPINGSGGITLLSQWTIADVEENLGSSTASITSTLGLDVIKTTSNGIIRSVVESLSDFEMLLVEPSLSAWVEKVEVVPAKNETSSVDGGDFITYTIHIHHHNSSSADAASIILYDSLLDSSSFHRRPYDVVTIEVSNPKYGNASWTFDVPSEPTTYNGTVLSRSINDSWSSCDVAYHVNESIWAQGQGMLWRDTECNKHEVLPVSSVEPLIIRYTVQVRPDIVTNASFLPTLSLRYSGIQETSAYRLSGCQRWYNTSVDTDPSHVLHVPGWRAGPATVDYPSNDTSRDGAIPIRVCERFTSIHRVEYAQGVSRNVHVLVTNSDNTLANISDTWLSAETDIGYLCDIDGEWSGLLQDVAFDWNSVARDPDRVTIADGRIAHGSLCRIVNVQASDNMMGTVWVGVSGSVMDSSTSIDGARFSLDYAMYDGIPESTGWAQVSMLWARFHESPGLGFIVGEPELAFELITHNVTEAAASSSFILFESKVTNAGNATGGSVELLDSNLASNRLAPYAVHSLKVIGPWGTNTWIFDSSRPEGWPSLLPYRSDDSSYARFTYSGDDHPTRGSVSLERNGNWYPLVSCSGLGGDLSSEDLDVICRDRVGPTSTATAHSFVASPGTDGMHDLACSGKEAYVRECPGYSSALVPASSACSAVSIQCFSVGDTHQDLAPNGTVIATSHVPGSPSCDQRLRVGDEVSQDGVLWRASECDTSQLAIGGTITFEYVVRVREDAEVGRRFRPDLSIRYASLGYSHPNRLPGCQREYTASLSPPPPMTMVNASVVSVMSAASSPDDNNAGGSPLTVTPCEIMTIESQLHVAAGFLPSARLSQLFSSSYFDYNFVNLTYSTSPHVDVNCSGWWEELVDGIQGIDDLLSTNTLSITGSSFSLQLCDIMVDAIGGADGLVSIISSAMVKDESGVVAGVTSSHTTEVFRRSSLPQLPMEELLVASHALGQASFVVGEPMLEVHFLGKEHPGTVTGESLVTYRFRIVHGSSSTFPASSLRWLDDHVSSSSTLRPYEVHEVSVTTKAGTHWWRMDSFSDLHPPFASSFVPEGASLMLVGDDFPGDPTLTSGVLHTWRGGSWESVCNRSLTQAEGQVLCRHMYGPESLFVGMSLEPGTCVPGIGVGATCSGQEATLSGCSGWTEVPNDASCSSSGCVRVACRHPLPSGMVTGLPGDVVASSFSIQDDGCGRGLEVGDAIAVASSTGLSWRQDECMSGGAIVTQSDDIWLNYTVRIRSDVHLGRVYTPRVHLEYYGLREVAPDRAPGCHRKYSASPIWDAPDVSVSVVEPNSSTSLHYPSPSGAPSIVLPVCQSTVTRVAVTHPVGVLPNMTLAVRASSDSLYLLREWYTLDVSPTWRLVCNESAVPVDEDSLDAYLGEADSTSAGGLGGWSMARLCSGGSTGGVSNMALGVRGFIPDRETVVSGTPVALTASLFGYGSAVDGMATASTIAYDMSMEMPDIVVGEPSLELVFLNRSVIDPAEPGFVSGGERVVYYWQLEHTEASTWPAMSLSLFDANLESISGGGLYSAVSLRVIFPSWEEEWLYEQDEGGDVSVVWSHDRPTEGVTCARNVSVGGTVGNGDPLWKQSECSPRFNLTINSTAYFEYTILVKDHVFAGQVVIPAFSITYLGIRKSAFDRQSNCLRGYSFLQLSDDSMAVKVPTPSFTPTFFNPIADGSHMMPKHIIRVCQVFSLGFSVFLPKGSTQNVSFSIYSSDALQFYPLALTGSLDYNHSCLPPANFGKNHWEQLFSSPFTSTQRNRLDIDACTVTRPTDVSTRLKLATTWLLEDVEGNIQGRDLKFLSKMQALVKNENDSFVSLSQVEIIPPILILEEPSLESWIAAVDTSSTLLYPAIDGGDFITYTIHIHHHNSSSADAASIILYDSLLDSSSFHRRPYDVVTIEVSNPKYGNASWTFDVPSEPTTYNGTVLSRSINDSWSSCDVAYHVNESIWAQGQGMLWRDTECNKHEVLPVSSVEPLIIRYTVQVRPDIVTNASFLPTLSLRYSGIQETSAYRLSGCQRWYNTSVDTDPSHVLHVPGWRAGPATVDYPSNDTSRDGAIPIRVCERFTSIHRVEYAQGVSRNVHVLVTNSDNTLANISDTWLSAETDIGYLCDIDGEWSGLLQDVAFDWNSVARDPDRVTIADGRIAHGSLCRIVNVQASDNMMGTVWVGVSGSVMDSSTSIDGARFSLDYAMYDGLSEVATVDSINLATPRFEFVNDLVFVVVEPVLASSYRLVGANDSRSADASDILTYLISVNHSKTSTAPAADMTLIDYWLSPNDFDLRPYDPVSLDVYLNGTLIESYTFSEAPPSSQMGEIVSRSRTLPEVDSCRRGYLVGDDVLGPELGAVWFQTECSTDGELRPGAELEFVYSVKLRRDIEAGREVLPLFEIFYTSITTINPARRASCHRVHNTGFIAASEEEPVSVPVVSHTLSVRRTENAVWESSEIKLKICQVIYPVVEVIFPEGVTIGLDANITFSNFDFWVERALNVSPAEGLTYTCNAWDGYFPLNVTRSDWRALQAVSEKSGMSRIGLCDILNADEDLDGESMKYESFGFIPDIAPNFRGVSSALKASISHLRTPHSRPGGDPTSDIYEAFDRLQQSLVIIEPELQIIFLRSTVDGMPKPSFTADAGDAITYEFVIQHTQFSDSVAVDLQLIDQVLKASEYDVRAYEPQALSVTLNGDTQFWEFDVTSSPSVAQGFVTVAPSYWGRPCDRGLLIGDAVETLDGVIWEQTECGDLGRIEVGDRLFVNYTVQLRADVPFNETLRPALHLLYSSMHVSAADRMADCYRWYEVDVVSPEPSTYRVPYPSFEFYRQHPYQRDTQPLPVKVCQLLREEVQLTLPEGINDGLLIEIRTNGSRTQQYPWTVISPPSVVVSCDFENTTYDDLLVSPSVWNEINEHAANRRLENGSAVAHLCRILNRDDDNTVPEVLNISFVHFQPDHAEVAAFSMSSFLARVVVCPHCGFDDLEDAFEVQRQTLPATWIEEPDLELTVGPFSLPTPDAHDIVSFPLIVEHSSRSSGEAVTLQLIDRNFLLPLSEQLYVLDSINVSLGGLSPYWVFAGFENGSTLVLGTSFEETGGDCDRGLPTGLWFDIADGIVWEMTECSGAMNTLPLGETLHIDYRVKLKSQIPAGSVVTPDFQLEYFSIHTSAADRHPTCHRSYTTFSVPSNESYSEIPLPQLLSATIYSNAFARSNETIDVAICENISISSILLFPEGRSYDIELLARSTGAETVEYMEWNIQANSQLWYYCSEQAPLQAWEGITSAPKLTENGTIISLCDVWNADTSNTAAETINATLHFVIPEKNKNMLGLSTGFDVVFREANYDGFEHNEELLGWLHSAATFTVTRPFLEFVAVDTVVWKEYVDEVQTVDAWDEVTYYFETAHRNDSTAKAFVTSLRDVTLSTTNFSSRMYEPHSVVLRTRIWNGTIHFESTGSPETNTGAVTEAIYPSGCLGGLELGDHVAYFDGQVWIQQECDTPQYLELDDVLEIEYTVRVRQNIKPGTIVKPSMKVEFTSLAPNDRRFFDGCYFSDEVWLKNPPELPTPTVHHVVEVHNIAPGNDGVIPVLPCEILEWSVTLSMMEGLSEETDIQVLPSNSDWMSTWENIEGDPDVVYLCDGEEMWSTEWKDLLLEGNNLPEEMQFGLCTVYNQNDDAAANWIQLNATMSPLDSASIKSKETIDVPVISSVLGESYGRVPTFHTHHDNFTVRITEPLLVLDRGENHITMENSSNVVVDAGDTIIYSMIAYHEDMSSFDAFRLVFFDDNLQQGKLFTRAYDPIKINISTSQWSEEIWFNTDSSRAIQVLETSYSYDPLCEPRIKQGDTIHGLQDGRLWMQTQCGPNNVFPMGELMHIHYTIRIDDAVGKDLHITPRLRLAYSPYLASRSGLRAGCDRVRHAMLPAQTIITAAMPCRFLSFLGPSSCSQHMARVECAVPEGSLPGYTVVLESTFMEMAVPKREVRLLGELTTACEVCELNPVDDGVEYTCNFCELLSRSSGTFQIDFFLDGLTTGSERDVQNDFFVYLSYARQTLFSSNFSVVFEEPLLLLQPDWPDDWWYVHVTTPLNFVLEHDIESSIAALQINASFLDPHRPADGGIVWYPEAVNRNDSFSKGEAFSLVPLENDGWMVHLPALPEDATLGFTAWMHTRRYPWQPELPGRIEISYAGDSFAQNCDHYIEEAEFDVYVIEPPSPSPTPSPSTSVTPTPSVTPSPSPVYVGTYLEDPTPLSIFQAAGQILLRFIVNPKDYFYSVTPSEHVDSFPILVDIEMAVAQGDCDEGDEPSEVVECLIEHEDGQEWRPMGFQQDMVTTATTAALIVATNTSAVRQQFADYELTSGTLMWARAVIRAPPFLIEEGVDFAIFPETPKSLWIQGHDFAPGILFAAGFERAGDLHVSPSQPRLLQPIELPRHLAALTPLLTHALSFQRPTVVLDGSLVMTSDIVQAPGPEIELEDTDYTKAVSVPVATVPLPTYNATIGVQCIVTDPFQHPQVFIRVAVRLAGGLWVATGFVGDFHLTEHGNVTATGMVMREEPIEPNYSPASVFSSLTEVLYDAQHWNGFHNVSLHAALDAGFEGDIAADEPALERVSRFKVVCTSRIVGIEGSSKTTMHVGQRLRHPWPMFSYLTVNYDPPASVLNASMAVNEDEVIAAVAASKTPGVSTSGRLTAILTRPALLTLYAPWAAPPSHRRTYPGAPRRGEGFSGEVSVYVAQAAAEIVMQTEGWIAFLSPDFKTVCPIELDCIGDDASQTLTLSMERPQQPKENLTISCPPACPDAVPLNIPSPQPPGTNSPSRALLPLPQASSRPRVTNPSRGLFYTLTCAGFLTGSDCMDPQLSSKCAYGLGSNCQPCPEGALCPGGYSLLAKPGFWVPPGEEQQAIVRARQGLAVNPPRPVPCKEPRFERCKGGFFSAGSSICGEGFAGFACSACAKGFYRTHDGSCSECEESNSDVGEVLAGLGMMFGGAIGVAAFLIASTLLIVKCRGGSLEGGVSRGVQFLVWTVTILQLVSQSGRIALPFMPPYLVNIFTFLQVSQFETPYVYPECLNQPRFMKDNIFFLVVLGAATTSLLLFIPWVRRAVACGAMDKKITVSAHLAQELKKIATTRELSSGKNRGKKKQKRCCCCCCCCRRSGSRRGSVTEVESIVHTNPMRLPKSMRMSPSHGKKTLLDTPSKAEPEKLPPNMKASLQWYKGAASPGRRPPGVLSPMRRTPSRQSIRGGLKGGGRSPLLRPRKQLFSAVEAQEIKNNPLFQLRGSSGGTYGRSRSRSNSNVSLPPDDIQNNPLFQFSRLKGKPLLKKSGRSLAAGAPRVRRGSVHSQSRRSPSLSPQLSPQAEPLMPSVPTPLASNPLFQLLGRRSSTTSFSSASPHFSPALLPNMIQPSTGETKEGRAVPGPSAAG